MSAIGGWANISSTEDERAVALNAMASACGRGGRTEAEISTTSLAAMVSVGGLVPVGRHREDELLVAVLGQASFDSDELSRIADELGAATAAAHAYRRHGPDCVKRMHGPFALAVSDGARRSGLLAIDRMAIRSLCYAHVGDGVVFATTADAVIAHPRVGRRLCRQGLFNYLYQETVPAPGTIYEGVRKLLPGQRVVIDSASASADFYWQLGYSDAPEPSAVALRAEFRDLVGKCVARTITSESVGAFLSGGTDSSTIAGVLTQLRGRPVDTYSIGFEAEGFDEMDYARITSRHFGTRAHEYYVTPRDVVAAIPMIAAAYDEPFGNASAVPTYCCARLARQDGKTLLLAGDGGDEIFGGNARYAKQKIFEWYGRLPSGVRRGLVEPVLFSGSWVRSVPPLRKAMSYVQQARTPLPDRLEAYNFLEREVLAEVFEPDFLAAIDPHEPRTIAREVYARTTSRSPVNRMMHLDLKKILADNDLRKVNGMCEAAGIEVRYPLLDDELVAFAGRLSARQKVRRLQLRHFFKEALKDFLPPQTLVKAKHGFGLPFGLWLQSDGELRELAHDSLTAFKHRGFVRPGYVDRLLHLHESSHASYFGVMIWIMIMLEHWLRARKVP